MTRAIATVLCSILLSLFVLITVTPCASARVVGILFDDSGSMAPRIQLPTFGAQLREWLKTLRKKNVYLVCATQEIADAAESPITATLLSACHTKIYLPDEEALTPSMSKAYQEFGLTETEIRILAEAQKKRDYYYRSVKGRRLFRLDLHAVGLAFAGMSSPDDQKVLDRIVAEAPPAQYAERILRHRKLDWAAELVAEAISTRRDVLES